MDRLGWGNNTGGQPGEEGRKGPLPANHLCCPALAGLGPPPPSTSAPCATQRAPLLWLPLAAVQLPCRAHARASDENSGVVT